MKTVFTLLLTLCIFTNSLALASEAPVDSAPIEAARALVDDYIAMQTEAPKQGDAVGKTFTGLGQQSHLARAVAIQVVGLEPEDFNLFLFYLMDRFVKKPQEREVLKGFIDLLHKTIAADLETTEKLSQGPAAAMLSGSYLYGLTYGVMFFIAARFTWRRIFANPQRTTAFLAQIEEQQALSRTGKLAKMVKTVGGKTLTNPTLLLLGGGAGLGYLNYVLQTHRTHRLDPNAILRVVQSNLACELSWQALKAHEELVALGDDNAKILKQADPLLKEMTDVQKQAEALLSQFPGLNSLDVKDRIFAQDLAKVPTAGSWQEFKSTLTEAEQSHDGLCRSMRLPKMIEDLQADEATLSSNLDTAKIVGQ